MKENYFLAFVAFVLLVATPCSSQIKSQLSLNSNLNKAEKIYIQTSSSVYTVGKRIWFKAIVTDSKHVPSKRSQILHVQLIGPNSNILKYKKLKLNEGVADNFFKLKQTLEEGRYSIRAYTLWNRNFDEEDVIEDVYIDVLKTKKDYENPLEDMVVVQNSDGVFNLKSKVLDDKINKIKVYIEADQVRDSVEIGRTIANNFVFNYSLPEHTSKARLLLCTYQKDTKKRFSKTLTLDASQLDLQFFPEGGKLVDGLVSKVGFKALDATNKGLKVEGYIKTDLDSTVACFSSNKLGMGAFMFQPEYGQRYFAHIEKSRGVFYKYELPQVHPKGYVLRCNVDETHVFMKLTSRQIRDESLHLTVVAKGTIYDTHDFKLDKGEYNIAVPKEKYPKGILKIRVTNAASQIVCERLIFNTNTNDDLCVTAHTNIPNYYQRDKVELEIETKDVTGKPVKADLSVFVLDKEVLGKMQASRSNIMSYFFLDSELRGAVEQPWYYFSAANFSKERDLDALMLTQGWRNYKYSVQSAPSFKYHPEKYLTLSGSIGEYFNVKKRPKKPLNISLMTFTKPKEVAYMEVDSTGLFRFDIYNPFKGEIDFVLQTRLENKKAKDFTINVDKSYIPKITIDAPKQYLDFFTSKKDIKRDLLKSSKAELVFPEQTIELDAVNLTGYKLTPIRKKMKDEFGLPDVVLDGKEILEKEESWSTGLFSVLHFRYSEHLHVKTRYLPSGGFFETLEMNDVDKTYIFVDGIHVPTEDYQILEAIPTDVIESVEIIENPKAVGGFSGILERLRTGFLETKGIISIITHSKLGLNKIYKPKGLYKGQIEGLEPVVSFYAPKYEGESPRDWKIKDLRALIHWAPKVFNDKGTAKIEFYNADNLGDMLVVVEAITPDGKIGYYNTTYKVVKHLGE